MTKAEDVVSWIWSATHVKDGQATASSVLEAYVTERIQDALIGAGVKGSAAPSRLAQVAEAIYEKRTTSFLLANSGRNRWRVLPFQGLPQDQVTLEIEGARVAIDALRNPRLEELARCTEACVRGGQWSVPVPKQMALIIEAYLDAVLSRENG